MGFAILPPEIKLGVYVVKKDCSLFGELIVVVDTWFYQPEVFYKKKQERPRMCLPKIMRELEYIGEFE